MRYCIFSPLLLLTLAACTADGHRQPPRPTGLSGQELAEIHCGGCHLLPPPELLDKTTWQNGVLPEMAYHLGMRDPLEKLAVLDPDEIATVLRAGAYPNGPVLAVEDWQKIMRFYVERAPEKLPPQRARSPVKTGLPFFEVRPLREKMTRQPMISLVKIDEARGCVYVGRREKQMLEVYNRSLKKTNDLPVSSPVSEVVAMHDSLFVLQMGIMEPNDRRQGQLLRITGQQQKTVLDSMQRPVQMALSDLDQDGIPDYLICQYGNESGKLAWYDGKTHEEHLLKTQSGARIAIVRDLNNDGLPDITVLMCQARESISIWYNRGKGVFDENIALQFPPVYGSSCIELADMNSDGHPDILYTNGDNADYSFTRKPYHGLRIFLNDGQNHFSERFFYPVYGASKALARDFDGDGDPDMALIAFFPDASQHPNEGFLFFENRGGLQFDISTFAEAAGGRWLVMDAGDVDGDGRPDIVLGSFFKSGLGQAGGTYAGPPLSLVWLRNVAGKR